MNQDWQTGPAPRDQKGIPIYLTPFRVVTAAAPDGSRGHKAVWLPRAGARKSEISLDASPVMMGGRERVVQYMANVYAETREVQ